MTFIFLVFISFLNCDIVTYSCFTSLFKLNDSYNLSETYNITFNKHLTHTKIYEGHKNVNPFKKILDL